MNSMHRKEYANGYFGFAVFEQRAGAEPAKRASKWTRTRVAIACGAALVVAAAAAAGVAVAFDRTDPTVPVPTTAPTTAITFGSPETTDSPTTMTTTHDPPPRNYFVPKEEWGGRPAKSQVNLTVPLDLVVVKHTAGHFCSDFEGCAQVVRDIQSMHVGDGAPDIWYNFLVGGDGNIYVGRGWTVENQNSKYAIDVAFIGNYTFGNDEVTELMDLAGKKILIIGAAYQALSLDFVVVNHNQTTRTTSPGENVYKTVMKWPCYSPIVFKV